ncbi:MAG TPA: thioredoxin family protein, partial [Ornithinibacter sp.]|nr:thioredoxin family protein [Ornithinibacter sp.]
EELPMRLSPTAFPAAAVAGGAALVLAGCGTAADPASATAATTSSASASPASPSSTGGSAPAAVPAGAYLSRAELAEQGVARAGTKVVYFFHASWCPTCRATEEAIARDGIPAGLTVVKVDDDDETDLRQQYGVTTQHTVVQVDPSGAQLAKWTGSEDGAAILAKTV